MVVNCCDHLILVHLQTHHHMIFDDVGVAVPQFVNCSSCFAEFQVSSAKVVIEVIPGFICVGGDFPYVDVIFEDSLLVKDD